MRNDTSERRAGYRWYGDTITWDTPSRYGYRYSAVLVDAATGYFLIFHLRTKDETAGKLIALIKSMRLNPYFSFNNHGHTFFTELRLDEAGELSSTNKEFLVQLREELGCNAEWCCGFDKRDAANAENAVKQVEIRAKSIMLESNLPRSWWLEATSQARVVARHPVGRLTSDCQGAFNNAPPSPSPCVQRQITHPADGRPREFPPRLHTHVSFIFVHRCLLAAYTGFRKPYR